MKNIIVTMSLLVISLGVMSLGQAHAGNEFLRQQVQQMPSGKILLKKIDVFAQSVGERGKENDEFRQTITTKIDNLQEKYNKQTSIQSQNISIILLYLERKVSDELGISNSRLLDRFKQVQTDSHKGKFSGRINKAKSQNYQRIHLTR